MKRPLTLLPVLAAAVVLAGCGSTDLVNQEIDAQKDRVETIIKEPDKIVDGIVQDELEQRGIDGQAPAIPGQP